MTALLLASWACQDIPARSGFVNDAARILRPQERQRLEETLAGYERGTTNEIGVLIVPSTKPLEIRQYGIRVADVWQPGKKGKDNGVLFIVAVQDRRMSIEVGRGLEGTLTDLQSAEILRQAASYFANGRYGDGVERAVLGIISVLGGKPVAPDRAVREPHIPAGVLLLVILVLVVLAVRSGIWFGPSFGWGGYGYRRSWGGSFGGGSGGFGSFGSGGRFGGGGASGGW